MQPLNPSKVVMHNRSVAEHNSVMQNRAGVWETLKSIIGKK